MDKKPEGADPAKPVVKEAVLTEGLAGLFKKAPAAPPPATWAPSPVGLLSRLPWALPLRNSRLFLGTQSIFLGVQVAV